MDLSPAPQDDRWSLLTEKEHAATLVIVGDSVALGTDQNAWPWQIAPKLNQAVGHDVPLNTHILARPGWGSDDRLRALQANEALWRPGATVLWVITLNDLLDEAPVILNGTQTRITGVCRDRATHCRKALFKKPVTGLVSWWRWHKALADNTSALQEALEQSAGREATANDLKRFADAMATSPAQGLVVVMPYLWRKPTPFAPVTQTAVTLAEDAGLPVLDLSDALLSLRVKELRCRPSDYVHPALEVHGLIAAEVAGELSKYGW
jgi:lysophospholipase L1-like esterase